MSFRGKKRKNEVGAARFFTQKTQLAAAAILVLGLGAGLAALPKALEADAQMLVMQGCKVSQTMTYARCGHQVLRRMDAESAWLGRGREGVEKLLLPHERLTAFSPAAISVESTLDLFCPDHTVVMLDANGEACLWENRYGFAMECVQRLGYTAPDEETRAKWTQGEGFKSREEALEAARKASGERDGVADGDKKDYN